MFFHSGSFLIITYSLCPQCIWKGGYAERDRESRMNCRHRSKGNVCRWGAMKWFIFRGNKYIWMKAMNHLGIKAWSINESFITLVMLLASGGNIENCLFHFIVSIRRNDCQKSYICVYLAILFRSSLISSCNFISFEHKWLAQCFLPLLLFCSPPSDIHPAGWGRSFLLFLNL